jgi:hypothetical protein
MSTLVPARAGMGSTVRAALWTLAAVLYRFDPLQYGFYPKCILLSLTGIYCPGCGALRATHALLHGHVLAAAGYNALWVAVLPFLAYALAARVTRSVSGRRLPTYALSGTQAKAVFWSVILFMLIRNIPVYPLSVLAP